MQVDLVMYMQVDLVRYMQVGLELPRRESRSEINAEMRASIYSCGHRLIDACASIYRCGHLFIDAATDE